MTAREAARAEWRKLKNRPLKEKLIHIGTYYWPHILSASVLLVLAVSLISSAVNSKNSAFQAYLLSTAPIREESSFEQDFACFAGINTDEFETSITASAYSVSGSEDMSITDSQVIAAWTASEALDVLAGDTENMLNYAYNGYFQDLRELLSPGQLKNWADYLLYIDQAVCDAIDSGENTVYTLPDPANPGEMEQPIPVLLSIPESSRLWTSYEYLGENPTVGVIGNAPNLDYAIAFLKYILP